MTSLELTPEQAQAGYRPLAGRILLEMEPPDAMAGSIVIPETARTQTPERTHMLIGRVLAVGFGPYIEGGESFGGIAEGDVCVGDRIVLAPLLQDLNKRTLLTSVTRVAAVLE